MSDPSTTDLQTRIAYLERLAEDLSDIVARQTQDIDRLTARVDRLIQREAEREAAEGAAVVIGNERPPHY